jgi:diguanylate cyclase (GGDEF)-like protein
LGGERRESRFEYRARCNDGSWRWFESRCQALGDEDEIRGVISIIRDISERKERERQLAVAAMTDSLTGLPNRRAFREAAARLAEDKSPEVAAIALFDIDHFKLVNDRFGHDVGDEVLQSFAFSALQQLRDGDTIARFGGEEFALLLPGTEEADAVALCERLRSAIADTVCLTAAGPVRFTISGGVAALGSDGLDAALKLADTALYQAKNQGRDRLMRAAA